MGKNGITTPTNRLGGKFTFDYKQGKSLTIFKGTKKAYEITVATREGACALSFWHNDDKEFEKEIFGMNFNGLLFVVTKLGSIKIVQRSITKHKLPWNPYMYFVQQVCGGDDFFCVYHGLPQSKILKDAHDVRAAFGALNNNSGYITVNKT